MFQFFSKSDKNVFFGGATFAQTRARKAFILGIYSYLVNFLVFIFIGSAIENLKILSFIVLFYLALWLRQERRDLNSPDPVAERRFNGWIASVKKTHEATGRLKRPDDPEYEEIRYENGESYVKGHPFTELFEQNGKFPAAVEWRIAIYDCLRVIIIPILGMSMGRMIK